MCPARPGAPTLAWSQPTPRTRPRPGCTCCALAPAAAGRLIETQGPAGPQLTTLAATAHGVVVFTHLWSSATGPLDSRHPATQSSLQAARLRVLAIATRIVPGHGPSFRPGPDTPV